MEQVGYGQYITENFTHIPYGVPIYTEDIACSA
jgi:hypothetical protein